MHNDMMFEEEMMMDFEVDMMMDFDGPPQPQAM